MQLSPYLSFNGQCEAAFKFYEQVLGGKISSLLPYEGSPMADEVPADWGKKVMHGEFQLGDLTIMGSDCAPDWFEKAQGTSLSVSVAEPGEADRIFDALAEGGEAKMPMQETFWAARFGVVTDQFGIPWMIGCDKGK